MCARRFAVNLVTASIANLAISKLLMVHCQFPIKSTPTSYLLTSSFPLFRRGGAVESVTKGTSHYVLDFSLRQPAAAELMALITPNYTVAPSDVDESRITAATPAQLAQALAEAKALVVAQQHPDDTVIGCDTVVDCDGAVFGKPSGEEDAVRMLHALSGREHKVHTGLCVVHGGKAYLATETTRVQFAPIEESDLLAYARTPEPYDKAGAYAIQGHAALWCSGIVGCYYNIMGLPVHRLAQVLRQAGAL